MTVLPLRRITDLTWQVTLLGHVLGYGAFRFRSAGQDPARRHLTFVPNAAELYRDVSELLFSTDYAGGAGDETGDEEPQPPTGRGGRPAAAPGGRPGTGPSSPPARRPDQPPEDGPTGEDGTPGAG